MSEPLLCPTCSRPLESLKAPNIMYKSELNIYYCVVCREETDFYWGDEGAVIETYKHYMLTGTGELKDLPPDSPRVLG